MLALKADVVTLPRHSQHHSNCPCVPRSNFFTARWALGKLDGCREQCLGFEEAHRGMTRVRERGCGLRAAKSTHGISGCLMRQLPPCVLWQRSSWRIERVIVHADGDSHKVRSAFKIVFIDGISCSILVLKTCHGGGLSVLKTVPVSSVGVSPFISINCCDHCS